MIIRNWQISFTLGGLLWGGNALAQNGSSHPVVIGSTGRAYGPTQAEWQYRQQYGRPSPGSQGNSGLQYVNGYPGGGFGGHGHSWNGWNGWGPQMFLGFDPMMPYPAQGYVFSPSTATYSNGYNDNLNFGNPGFGAAPNPLLFPNLTPPVLQPLPPNDPLANGLGLGLGQSNAAINSTPFPTAIPQQIIPPSTPKAIENSFQYQTQGDLQFQMLNYYAAGERYRKSMDAARDRADPRVRLAITFAARGRFPEAVDQLKLAVAIDPTVPQTSPSLEDLFGAANLIEKERVKERVAEWTLQDPRDPNRLFLSGVFLYLDGNPNARMVLETATLIAGEQPHLTAFLTQRTVPIPKPATVTPEAPIPQPPAGNKAPVAPAQEPVKRPLNEMEIPALPPLPEDGIPPPPHAEIPAPVLPPLTSP